MKKTFTLLFTLATLISLAQPFTAGNLVIVRVGDQTTLVNRGNAVSLLEVNTAGVLQSTLNMPTVASGANAAFCLGGTSTSEGFPTRSPNKKYLTLVGYDQTPPHPTSSISSTTSAAVNRVAAIIDVNKSIGLSTRLNNYCSANSPRSAITLDSTSLWLCGGTGGIVYAPVGGTAFTDVIANTARNASGTTTASTNFRCINIFDNQLYVGAGAASCRMGIVGTGIPSTAGQVIDSFPGIPIVGSSLSVYQYFMADMVSGEPGVDVLYLCDDAATGGIRKYSKVAGTWVSNGTTGTATDGYRGLVGRVAQGGTIELYGIRKNTASGGGELFSLSDPNGWNGSLLSAPSAALLTAGLNESYRGIEWTPESATPVPISLLDFYGSRKNGSIDLEWISDLEQNAKGFDIERSANGRTFSKIGFEAARGSNYNTRYQFSDAAPLPGVNYYRLKLVDKDGKFAYSKVIAIASSAKGINLFPNPAISAVSVNHPAASNGASIRVISQTGVTVLTQSIKEKAVQTTLNVAALPTGNYFVEFINDGQKTISKLNKQ